MDWIWWQIWAAMVAAAAAAEVGVGVGLFMVYPFRVWTVSSESSDAFGEKYLRKY